METKIETIVMEIKCWALDFAEALFSGHYKRNRRQTRNIINIVKKARAIMEKQNNKL